MAADRASQKPEFHNIDAAARPFFPRQTKVWGDVVRENNIKA